MKNDLLQKSMYLNVAISISMKGWSFAFWPAAKTKDFEIADTWFILWWQLFRSNSSHLSEGFGVYHWYQAGFRLPLSRGCNVAHIPSTEGSRYRVQDVSHRWMNIAVRFYAPVLQVCKSFSSFLFAFLQLKILGISRMVNIMSARMLFLTYITAVLTYSSGLALCPQKKNYLISTTQKYFCMFTVNLNTFSLPSLSCIAFNQ